MTSNLNRLVLVRHGETDGNRQRIVQVPETPLNENGRAQATRLGRRLGRDLAARRVALWTSDYQRARETAEPVLEALGLDPVVEPLLRERNFGELRGRTYQSLDVDPFAPEYHPPNGESWEQFFDRVAGLWRKLEAVVEQREIPADTLVVVTHGLVLRALVERHLGPNPGTEGEWRSEPWPNTAVTEVETTTNGLRFHRFACTAHLETERDEASGMI